jgi:hypothetical protein
MVRTTVGLGASKPQHHHPLSTSAHATVRHAPAGLVLVEDVAPQQQRVNLGAHRVRQDLLKRGERVILADGIFLVDA